MRTILKEIMTKDGFVATVLIASAVMAAAGLAGGAPIIRIAVVIGAFNFLAAFWFNKLAETKGDGGDQNP